MHNSSAILCTNAIVTSGESVFRSNEVCVKLEDIITREMAINQILSSIAIRGLANSHILNAEGEKTQYILGTLPGYNGPSATFEEVLAINKSIIGVINAIGQNQILLKHSLYDVLSRID